uniref:Uncharacterized protein n=1 Tax=Ailuropoda melanoleuca TaxID=9646 RepID=A0A7N5KM46_AILME
MESDLHLHYYVGHKGSFDHRFPQFQFPPDGKLRYANNSNYTNDVMIRLMYIELEIVFGDEHVSLTTSTIGSLSDVSQSKGPEGLQVLYYLAQDLKCFVFSLPRLHYQIKPV